MAVAVAGPFGLDMSELDISTLLDSDVITRTSSKYVLDYYGQIITFTGTGFTYSGDYPVSGMVTGLRVDEGGVLIYQVTGFSTPVSSWVTWANNDDTLGAMQAVFAGHDAFTGAAGADTLAAFAGNDSLSGGGGDDFLNGGPGVGNDTISGGLGNDTLGAAAGANYLRGDEGNDSVIGGSGFDDINGNQGNDTAHGNADGDWVVGGKDQDLLYGDAGDDIVYGNLGEDTCDGGAGADIVRGGQGNDVVTGGDGDDWLSGDRGSDTITGGAGADIFHTFGDAGVDRVVDFHASEGDRVQVDPGTTYTLVQSGADTVINMTGGGQMILVGVTLSSLSGAWIFGA